MISFIFTLCVLFGLSLCFDKEAKFSKDKMLPLKAILAILIVADHLTFHISADWIQPMRKWGAPIVSVFLFISGYGLVESYKKKGKDYLNDFFQRRVWKVILPSIVALGFYYLSTIGTGTNYINQWKELFLYGVPIVPYSWYVAAIIVLYSIFWITFKFLPESFKVHGLLALSAIAAITMKAIGYDRCWYICTLGFASGAYFSWYNDTIKELVFKNRLTYLLAFCASMACVGCFYYLNSIPSYMMCYIFIPLAVALIISKLEINRINNTVISFIGGISYEIYLCQGIVMDFFRNDRISIESDLLYLLCVYAGVMLLALFVNRASNLIYRIA